MPYLFIGDYTRFIQADNLQQVVNKDLSIIDNASLDAEATAREKLVQRYILDQEFQETEAYDNTLTTYLPGNRVYLDAIAYDATKTYILGALTLHLGNVYVSTFAITVPEAFDLTHWTKLGAQHSLFYIPYPHPLFDLYKFYKVGDVVYFDGKNYTCVIKTSSISHETLIQFNSYQSIPSLNIFPNDQENGVKYWGSGTPVSIPANSLPAQWNSGDNRNRSLLRSCIAIALYYMHDRIAPKNVPVLRQTKFNMAVEWLNECGSGDRTPGLPVIQPRTGGAIRWGGQIKNNNNY